MYKCQFTPVPLQTYSSGFKPKYKWHLFHKTFPCWFIYIPIIIHIAVDAYSEQLFKEVSQCIYLFCPQDINALKAGLLLYFFFKSGKPAQKYFKYT